MAVTIHEQTMSIRQWVSQIQSNDTTKRKWRKWKVIKIKVIMNILKIKNKDVLRFVLGIIEGAGGKIK